jgi:hypothetical protein
MSTQQERRRTVSPDARKKCIERARKAVQAHEKWGLWLGLLYFVLGILGFGLSIAFIILFQRFVQFQVNQAQGEQNLAWMGFLLGLTFGAIASVTAFASLRHVVEGIKLLRGDPASHILVEYHDAIVNMMHEQDGATFCESNAPAPHCSSSPSELHV